VTTENWWVERKVEIVELYIIFNTQQIILETSGLSKTNT